MSDSETKQRPVVEVVTDESTPVVAVPYTTALLPVNRVSIVPSKKATPSTSRISSMYKSLSPTALPFPATESAKKL